MLDSTSRCSHACQPFTGIVDNETRRYLFGVTASVFRTKIMYDTILLTVLLKTYKYEMRHCLCCKW